MNSDGVPAERSEREASLTDRLVKAQTSPNVNWCFTVKQLTNENVTYDPVLDKMNMYGVIRHCCQEQDSKGKFHIHGIVALPKGFLRKKLITPNYNIKLDEVINEYQWLKYIYKDQKKPSRGTQRKLF